MAILNIVADVDNAGNLIINAGDELHLDGNANTVTYTFSNITSQPTITGTGRFRFKNNTVNFCKVEGNSTYMVQLSATTTINFDYGGAGSLVKMGFFESLPTPLTTGGSGVTLTMEDDCLFQQLDVTIGGGTDALVLDASGLGKALNLQFRDAGGAGMGASTGVISLAGDGGNKVTLDSAGGQTPTNGWDLAIAATITAEHCIFEGFSDCAFTGVVDILSCIFQWGGRTGAEYGCHLNNATVNAFNGNTIDECGGAASWRVSTDNLDGITGLVITAPVGFDIALTGSTVEMVASHFDAANCSLDATSWLTSDNHNSVADEFYIVLSDGDTVAYSEFTTEPGVADDIYIYIESGGTSATFNFDEAAKTCGTLNIQTGKAIQVGIVESFEVDGDCTQLYSVWITNAKIWTVSAVGAGANVEVEFQDNTGTQIRFIGSTSEFNAVGDFDYSVKVSINGVDDETAPDVANGIRVYGAGGILDLDFTQFYHMKVGSLSDFLGDSNGADLEMRHSSLWFRADTTALYGVEEIGPIDGDCNMTVTQSAIVSYDNAPYWVNTQNGFTSLTWTASWLTNCVTTIMDISDTAVVVFWQGHTDIRHGLPSIVSKDTDYVGGENIPIERTHKTKTIVEFAGLFSQSGDFSQHPEFGYDHPLGWRFPITELQVYYENEELDLTLCWERGIMVAGQITELKPFFTTGHTNWKMPLYYSLVFEGDTVIAP